MSTVNFGDLLTIFPEVELPLFLDEDSASLFSQNNDPFPEELFDRFYVLSCLRTMNTPNMCHVSG